MTAGFVRREAHNLAIRALAVALAAALMGAPPAWAGKLTCLTGTDPSVANDAYQLALTRAFIVVFGCGCSNFDGSPGKKTADFVKCFKQYVDTFVESGNLRKQCKGTLLKEAKATTCGADPSKNAVTCVRKTAGGKVTCAIKPSAQCVDTPGKFTQVACTPLYPYCVDSADTSNDGLIGSGDSGACAPLPALGYTDWRIPTIAELQTIIDTSVPGCGSGSPCVPAVFSAGCTAGCFYTGCCTAPYFYWSASSVSLTQAAWYVSFGDGSSSSFRKDDTLDVRAVRGGS